MPLILVASDAKVETDADFGSTGTVRYPRPVAREGGMRP
jgi:hypothetical protein